jgi:hypothetical protein
MTPTPLPQPDHIDRRPRQSTHTYPHHVPVTPTASSHFLSPIQEARILSWREHTSQVPEGSQDRASKSAPATMDHDPSCASSSSHGQDKVSDTTASTSRYLCSCAARHQQATSKRPQILPRHTTHSPSQDYGRGTDSSQMKSYYSSKKKSGTSMSAPTTPATSHPPTQGFPTDGRPQFDHGHQIDSRLAPPQQFLPQGATNIPPVMAQPPPPRPDPPRIAGARDPISQN